MIINLLQMEINISNLKSLGIYNEINLHNNKKRKNSLQIINKLIYNSKNKNFTEFLQTSKNVLQYK